MRTPGIGRARPRVATCSVRNASCDHPLRAGTGPCAVHAAGLRPRRKGRGPFTYEPLRHSRRPTPCADFGTLRAPYQHRVVAQGAPLAPCVSFLLSDGTTVPAFISSIVLPPENTFPPCARTCERYADPRGPGRHRPAPPRARCELAAAAFPLALAANGPRRLFLTLSALRSRTDGRSSAGDQLKPDCAKTTRSHADADVAAPGPLRPKLPSPPSPSSPESAVLAGPEL